MAAHAQDAGEDATASAASKENAREFFVKGVTASEAGDLEGAVDAFLASFQHYPAPNTAVNVAGIYLELRKYDETIEWAERAKGLADIQPSAVEIADSYIAQAQPYASKPVEETSPTELSDSESSLEATLTDEPLAEEEDTGGALTEQWWFWTGVGVLVVGATVGIAVAASGEEDPVGGNLMPGVVTW